MSLKMGIIATICMLAVVFMSVEAGVECWAAPQSPYCVDYVFPDSQKIIDDFCGMMDNMPACSIYKICQNATYNATTNNDGVCHAFSIASDLCFDMPDMGPDDCNKIASECPADGATVILECETKNLTSTMPKFTELRDHVSAMCSATPQPDAELCSRCTAANSYHCDLLATYTSLCKVAPESPECDQAVVFCDSIASYDWPLCIGEPAPISPSSPSPAPVAPVAPTSPRAAPAPQHDTPSAASSLPLSFVLAFFALFAFLSL